MRGLVVAALACLWGGFITPVHAQHGLIEHALTIELNPEDHQLRVSDQITTATPFPRKSVFSLHRNLTPYTPDKDIKITQILSKKEAISARYTLELQAGINRFKINYAGQIYHPLEDEGKEQARGYRNTPGLISDRGVYLAGSSYWYPQFEGQSRLSFTLNTALPEGWLAVSQGARTKTGENKGKATSSWHSPSPQEEIYLIAAPFTEYTRQLGRLKAQVFLREADEQLANKYLQASAKYLQMYETLLGPYPYSKFALVENFWETGFGMPSFTLLGSKVIRLPFILNSSYPHEILHNWWGNGVYVDYANGNWSEGLTAYLADHLIKEQQNKGIAYRQQSLQKYADYAANHRDFPLSEFRGRHSAASEAVGYGKTMMLMHMLRQSIGDQAFLRALQQFYQQQKFKKASFEDLRVAFEHASDKPLTDFFDQWVNQAGAPTLKLSDSRLEPCDDQTCLHFSLQQTQAGAAYQLEIPIAITLAGVEQAQQRVVSMQHKRQAYTLALAAKPTRIDIDPEFDLFRKLALAETPPAFTQLFGSHKMLIVLPNKAGRKMQQAWRDFADDLAKMGPDTVSVVWDTDLERLPQDQAIAVLGWENLHAGTITSTISAFGVNVEVDQIKFAGQPTPRANHAIAFVTRFNDFPRAFIAADLVASLAGLGRKLPHYHKYSFLTFSGDEPENELKGRWPVVQSPMTALFNENAKRGKLAKRSALISPPAEYSAERMLQTIHFLTNDALQGRGFGEPGLEQAANYIAAAFQKSGLRPGGDEPGSYFQSWQEAAADPARKVRLKNVIGVIPGGGHNSKQSVVIGAHYDHLGTGWPDVRAGNQGRVHPGADDNASGVAVLLELARVLGQKLKLDRDIVFIAFTGEEAGRYGSKYYLHNAPDKQPFAMLNLDTVGRLGDGKLLVLGAESADEWPHIFRGIGFVSGIEIAMVNEPLDASDQISFQKVGIPAVQLFSGANLDYHRPTDTVDKIDPQGLVKVAIVAKEVLEYLGGREHAMSSNLDISNQDMGHGDKTANKTLRKVSLGSIPDFAYLGEGYRLDGVVPNSPVANAGLKKGDIITKINQSKIAGLRDLSDILKSFQAGQTLAIVFLRQGVENTAQATLIKK